MNNKNKHFANSVMPLLVCLAFAYGIGVGHYHWFPYHAIEEIKINLASLISGRGTDINFNKHKHKKDKEIIYESLRKDMEYNVVLLAGQSNMVGSGDIATFQHNEQQLPVNVDYYNFGRGSGLIYNVHKFGPEISLSRNMHSRFPNENFVFIKYAVGGSSMLDWSPEWTKDKAAVTGNPQFGSLYAKFIEKINHITEGVEVKFSALIWMQGETDAKFPEVGIEYYANLSRFIESIKKDINQPDLPIILGRINPPDYRFPAVASVRNAQERAAKELVNVHLINTDDLPKWNDELHYNSQGQWELGERFSGPLKDIIIAQQSEK